MRFSRRTFGALARVLDETNTHTELSALAYELGYEDITTGSNKLARCLNLVKTLEAQCEGKENDRPVVDLLERALDPLNDWQFENNNSVMGLIASLEVDGFDYQDNTLIPTTPEPAALSPQISVLEQELQDLGLDVAARHYSQACENLAKGNFEAANGQVRSYFENLIIMTCQEVTSQKAKNAKSALQKLRDSGDLVSSESDIFRGLWGTCHTRGPHQGLSNKQEAIFRLHMATAIGRYLLHKFH